MTQHNAIKLFETKKVRTIWDDKEEKWYFSIVDVVAVLTDSPNPRKYWSVLKTRLKKEGSGRCVKMRTFFFLSTKPRLSQAGALLLPKDFVSLGIRFSL